MPTLEGLLLAQKLNAGNAALGNARQDRGIAMDAAAQKKQTVGEVSELLKAGKHEEAFATLLKVDPDGAAKLGESLSKVSPIFAEKLKYGENKGKLDAEVPTESTPGQVAHINANASLANSQESRSARKAERDDKWASEKWSKITSHPTFKNYQEYKLRQASLEKAATDPNAMNDIASVFGFMKTLDPQSVVRESEYATAAQAGSLLTRVKNAVSKAEKGEILTSDQRTDILKMTRHLGAAYKQNYDDLIKPVILGAQKKGIDTALFDPYNVDENNHPRPKQQQPTGPVSPPAGKQVIQNGHIFQIDANGSATPIGPVK